MPLLKGFWSFIFRPVVGLLSDPVGGGLLSLPVAGCANTKTTPNTKKIESDRSEAKKVFFIYL